MAHRQLSLDERYQIAALRRQGCGVCEIARQLGRAASTIGRELRRNQTVREWGGKRVVSYDSRMAHHAAMRRRRQTGVARRKIQGELAKLVEQRLLDGWSPEHICGRLQLELDVRLCHETIYQHVLRDAFETRGILRYALRFGGYKQHRFRRSRHAQRTRRGKHHIADRPAAANDRTELGHWERDCVLGKVDNDAALLTLVDRKSRYAKVILVERVAVADVAEATIKALAPHRATTKSITNDNGAEFQRAPALETTLGIPIFFTKPSAPWQRGSIENLNGLIRQYVPKGTDIDALPRWLPAALEDTLNHRPRKVLGYRTPHEVFFGERMELLRGELLRFGLEFSRTS
jgi:IS30 family transposase